MVFAQETPIEQIEVKAKETFDLIGYFKDMMKEFLPDVLIGVVFFVVGFFIIKIFITFFKKVLSKSSMEKSIAKFLSQMLYMIMIVIVAIVSLSIAGIPTTTFTVLIGGLGVAIGLGFQNNIANFSSGIFIILNNLYKTGDFVEIERGKSGTVDSINLMTTTLITVDSKTIFVPNSIMTSEVVTNYSNTGYRTLWIKLELSHDSDIQKALDIFSNILHKNEYILKYKNIDTHILDISRGRVVIEGTGTVINYNYLPATYDIQKQVKIDFDKNGIKFYEYDFDTSK